MAKTIIMRSNNPGLADFKGGWTSIRKDGDTYLVEVDRAQYDAMPFSDLCPFDNEPTKEY